MKLFADEVNAGAAGKLRIVVHTGGSLYKLADMTQAVQTNQIQGGEIILSILSNEIPLFEADSVPFLAATWDEAWKLYQGTKALATKSLNERGLVPLYSVAWPGQGFYTKVPLESPADFKGKKLRAPSVAQSRYARALGMEPTVIDATEISQAFSTGIVDANLTSSPVGPWTSAWDYAKYFYNADVGFGRSQVFVNKKSFDSLPADVRQVIVDAAAKAETRGWEMAKQQDVESMDTMKAKGMQVLKPSPAVMEALRAAGDPLRAEWEKRAGPEVSAAVKQAVN
jgi:TRAP-type C4-dicarboxylate transport system substrate-binding protein